jgi:hypothetical protein
MTILPRQIIIDLVEGDAAPDLAVRFVGLALGPFSPIVFKVQKEDGTRFERTMIPDLTDEELAYVPWQNGDLVEGRHKAEIELTQVSDSKKLTLPRKYPIILNVRRDFD